MALLSKYSFACLFHFVFVYLVLKSFSFIISNSLLAVFINLAFWSVCLIISYFTFEFTKRKFLNDKVQPERKAVLITGCDSGFGHDLAKRLDTIGFHVYASCLFPNGAGAENLKNECSERLKVFEMNVANDESVEEAFTFVKKSLRNLEFWALINNAGTQKGFTIDFASVQDFKDTMEVNAFGMLRVTKAFLPLIKQFRGRIINLTSLHGRIPSPHNSPYVMSKYAASGFSDCLRLEMHGWNIPVIQVEPELYRTLLTDYNRVGKCLKLENDAVPPEVREEYGEKYFEELSISTLRYLKACSSNETIRVINDLENAVTSKDPDIVYNPCRNYFARIFFKTLELYPYVFREQILNFTASIFKVPKPLKY